MLVLGMHLRRHSEGRSWCGESGTLCVVAILVECRGCLRLYNTYRHDNYLPEDHNPHISEHINKILFENDLDELIK